MQIPLPDSFDEFLKTEKPEEEKHLLDKLDLNIHSKKEEKKDLDSRFEQERESWTVKISEMTKRMKNVMELQDLMIDVYTERQRAIEYYHFLITFLINVNKNYRRKYAERFKHYTDSIQIRVNKDQINILINNDLETLSLLREKTENHAKFMNNTAGTIDNIIYGIKYRIEIEQLSRGK